MRADYKTLQLMDGEAAKVKSFAISMCIYIYIYINSHLNPVTNEYLSVQLPMGRMQFSQKTHVLACYDAELCPRQELSFCM